jgi:hypothetical protein
MSNSNFIMTVDSLCYGLTVSPKSLYAGTFIPQCSNAGRWGFVEVVWINAFLKVESPLSWNWISYCESELL